jgi:peptidoglycan/LPS O-acetylase OafA/YrhL
MAALVVAVSHAVFAGVPALANGYAQAAAGPANDGLRALVFSPLHVVWAGQEAVLVFFVLSGFVLTRVALSWDIRRFARYYPSRLLRLYLPVWGSVAVALALREVATRQVLPGATWWLDDNGRATVDLGTVVHAATLLDGFGGFAINTVLWTLKWEIVFSLLLPVFVAMALLTRRAKMTLPALAAAFLIIVAARSEALRYLSIFSLGALLAGAETSLARATAAFARRPAAARVATAVLTPACVLGLTAHWWTDAHRTSSLMGKPVVVAVISGGALMAVVAAITLPSWRRALETPVAQWLGERSFSLYLVHVPIIVTLAFGLGGRPQAVPFLFVSLLLALAGAECFFRVVERPAHRLARAIGRPRLARRPAATVPTTLDVVGRPAA